MSVTVNFRTNFFITAAVIISFLSVTLEGGISGLLLPGDFHIGSDSRLLWLSAGSLRLVASLPLVLRLP